MGEIKPLWLDANKCTGCGLCANTCPQSAIKMLPNTFGFINPIINDNCINCNLCEEICVKRTLVSKGELMSVFACQSSDNNNRFFSTSGGMFSELVKPIIRNGGYAVGAGYNADNMVEHICIDNECDLLKIQQSKYVQSDSKRIYSDTKKLLDEGKNVAFCGTPCQCAALKAYLNYDYDNLLVIDFICRGVNSPKAYYYWLKEIEEKNSKRIKRVWFKYKDAGWKKSPRRTRIDFEDDSYILVADNENSYMRGYLDSNLIIRPSCGHCDFKGINRVSDITLADFWGIDEDFNDDFGTSMLMINTTKGMNSWELIKDKVVSTPKSIDSVIRGNSSLMSSVLINKNSEKFLENLDRKSFSVAINKYSKRSVIERIIAKFL
ncbi:MAG: Coenzyme F420 hydrogenase/dehydrogenase, beta subunit C-terminal domain [Saccharofermentans sp.]|nr:Coenzyme F420 hydrogenase/dehydrogenase, beta subunit C-terminal domain [Saccharofermentans sp.]